MNALQRLSSFGQSPWLDFITRRFIAEGSLKRLIDQDGIKGVTSNPTIFQKAFAGGSDYDADIKALFGRGFSAVSVFESLAVQDIQSACDVFLPVYQQTGGADGFVSMEVNPHLALDAKGTFDEARRLRAAINRPNAMIKIPATSEGLAAIENALADGISVNVTLIFSTERYEAVIDAWLEGLERAAQAGKPLAPIASVASFFVSRVDALVDKQLGNQKALAGKAAIANAQAAYALFERTKQSSRWQALAAKGARIQRPLWASTGVKNPAYRDVVYVEELIGQDTVNTMPLATIDAFRDHGAAKKSLPASGAATLKALAEAGIQMTAVTHQLEQEGLKLFVDSFDELIRSLEQKKAALV